MTYPHTGQLMTARQVHDSGLVGDFSSAWIRKHLVAIEQRYGDTVVKYYADDIPVEMERLGRLGRIARLERRTRRIASRSMK